MSEFSLIRFWRDFAFLWSFGLMIPFFAWIGSVFPSMRVPVSVLGLAYFAYCFRKALTPYLSGRLGLSETILATTLIPFILFVVVVSAIYVLGKVIYG